MHLSASFFSALPKVVNTETTKHFIIFNDSNGKKAYFSGRRIQLLSYNSDYGKGFVEVTEQEAKKKHLGKVRCLGTVTSENELLEILSKYFSFEISFNPQKPVIQEKNSSLKQLASFKIKKYSEIRIDQAPQDRDEKELIKAYRETTCLKMKDKIFSTILFKRGVNGKTWSQIVKNYISYNKHKFSHFQDRTEEDFYQDIVLALHKQVSKWFDISSESCFSTYAWFVIKCAFSRILQTLSTQKRKITQNVELDNPEYIWSEVISSESTLSPQTNFVDQFININLCEHIEAMFQLKQITAPAELKEELLKIIRNKSTVHNSLYSLAKKYKMNVEDIFSLERDLRENLKKSMIHDIIVHLKYGISGDEQIATKFKRSKGHVTKTKRYFVTSVKSKLQGI